MKRRWLLALTAAMALLAPVASFAADVTGKWVGDMGGGEFTMTFNFKQEGTKLTGTADGPGGAPMQIQAGKVEGNKISFSLEPGRPDEHRSRRNDQRRRNQPYDQDGRRTGRRLPVPIKLKRAK